MTDEEARDEIEDALPRFHKRGLANATNPTLVAAFKVTLGLFWFFGTLLAIGHTIWELAQ